MQFVVCDTLTGRIVGDLDPNKWELTDPLLTPGTGTLTVPLPTDPDLVARLVELTRPRTRWVALMDDLGRFLWGGPIPRRPARNGGEITVPLVDWRSWFYRAPLRPTDAGARRNYIKVGASAREQCFIMTDLAMLALTNTTTVGAALSTGAPRMVVDAAPASGTTRELTALMLDRSIGDVLQSIQERDGACEWYTYVTWDGDESSNVLLPHFAVAWPERRQRTSPVRVEYRVGTGGNAHDYAWPEGQDANTRAWAVGEGEPPDQVFTSDQYPEIADGSEVIWETTLGPLDGVVKKATAFDYAFAEIQRSRGLDGQAEFSIVDERIPLGDVMTGDRARILLSDAWETTDVAAARIVDRTLSGGRDQPLMQRIVVNLADDSYPDDGSTPGELVTE